MKMAIRMEFCAAVSALIVSAMASTSNAQESDRPNKYLVESRIYTFTAREAMMLGGNGANDTLVFFQPKVDSSVHLGSNMSLFVGHIQISLEGVELDI